MATTVASAASRALSGLLLARRRPPHIPSFAAATATTAPTTVARRRRSSSSTSTGDVGPSYSASSAARGPSWRPRQPRGQPRRSLSDDLKRRAIDALKSSGGGAEAAAAEAEASAADAQGAVRPPGTIRNAGGLGTFGGGDGRPPPPLPDEAAEGEEEVVVVAAAAGADGPDADDDAADPADDPAAAAAEEADDADDAEDASDSAAAAEEPPPVDPDPFVRTTGVHLHEFAPKIVVAGVGGAGTNAVNNMVASGLAGVEFLALNTDAQHLSSSLSPTRLQIGTQLTSGLGCGANPDAGRLAAEESSEAIQSCIEDAHMVFITAGMGGGTGTGAAPVVAGLCYDLGILTVSVVTTPFRFEGTHRRRLALEGIDRLRQVSDTLICVPNQNLFNLAGEDTSFVDAFKLADDVLLAGVRSVTDLMTSPGLINLDFADVQSVMHGMGNALLGTGQACRDDDVGGGGGEEGEVGDAAECRAVRAARMALNNPLLGEGDADVGSAKGMLVNMTGGSDMTLREVDRAAAYVTERVLDPDANIIFGSAYDASLTGCVRVSVVATGIEEGENE